MTDNNRQSLLKFLYLGIAVIAYGYLAYRLATYDRYADLAGQLSNVTGLQAAALGLAVALFPLNIMAEAVKWRYLLRGVYPMTLRESIRQVYYGTAGAFITPARLGEYPTRVAVFRREAVSVGDVLIPAVALGFVGSFALSALQVITGIPAAMRVMSLDRHVWVAGGVLLAVYLLTPMLCRRLQKRLSADSSRPSRLTATVEALARLTAGELTVTLLLSAVRYLIYCCQLALVLYSCSVSITMPDLAIAIATYYLLVTVTPSVPIADVGIRGSWAVVVFSQYSGNLPGIAVATLIMWIINSVLPMIVGSVMMHKTP